MLPKSLSNIEDGKQLIKSSGSVGANYIEANEKLGDRDFKFRLKIARKEAKESQFWLILLKDFNPDHAEIISNLIEESEQLRKIFSSIILKS
ncbi:MAG: four helix bundle protein [Aquimarina sp.]|nr:four helix bundle protein [Aquimarina sp.]